MYGGLRTQAAHKRGGASGLYARSERRPSREENGHRRHGRDAGARRPTQDQHDGHVRGGSRSPHSRHHGRHPDAVGPSTIQVSKPGGSAHCLLGTIVGILPSHQHWLCLLGEAPQPPTLSLALYNAGAADGWPPISTLTCCTGVATAPFPSASSRPSASFDGGILSRCRQLQKPSLRRQWHAAPAGNATPCLLGTGAGQHVYYMLPRLRWLLDEA